MYRPVTVFRCRGGRCLAGEDAFAEMQRRKVECLEYYNIYVDILARLSNRTPRSYHPFAAAGADAEGVRRSRGSPFGSDICDQPHFRSWFGERAFQVSDASVRSALESLVREWKPDVTMASPPCQPYSTADMQGATKAVAMIPLIRDHLSSLGGLYAIENVKGASREMGSSAVLFYGAYTLGSMSIARGSSRLIFHWSLTSTCVCLDWHYGGACAWGVDGSGGGWILLVGLSR